MTRHAFHLVNVFATSPLSGNALCVFEDGAALTDEQMQALARQFNLSETSFLLPSTVATARVRIFTPSFEMPFAGHPTLGTAYVVRALAGQSPSERVVLDMKAGLVEVTTRADEWTLRAAVVPATHGPDASNEQLASMLGVAPESVAPGPLWVDTGAEQLVVPLTSADAVRSAKPNADLMARHGFSAKRGASMAYVWAPDGEGRAVARFFFLVNGAVVEDPATGSACANLGGWMVASAKAVPVRLEVRQGEAIRRPSILRLDVDVERRIFVTGRVLEVGRGTLAV
jgi:trans-2,3-dihydro-3-hydroxyanthranilate isomerase